MSTNKNMRTIREWLEEMLTTVPDDQLNEQTPGFVMIVPLKNHPVTLSNFPPEISAKLINAMDGAKHVDSELFQKH